MSNAQDIPVWEKYTLTIEEASKYFRIGENKLRRLAEENKDAGWLIMNGNRIQIKRRQFEKVIDKLDAMDNPLPHITPHTLRHTFCTRLASKNMNPKDLQYIMGHSNISITMNWYAHASIDTAKSEVQRLIA